MRTELKKYLKDRIDELAKLSISRNEEFSDQMVARKAELERLELKLGLKKADVSQNNSFRHGVAGRAK